MSTLNAPDGLWINRPSERISLYYLNRLYDGGRQRFVRRAIYRLWPHCATGLFFGFVASKIDMTDRVVPMFLMAIMCGWCLAGIRSCLTTDPSVMHPAVNAVGETLKAELDRHLCTYVPVDVEAFHAFASHVAEDGEIKPAVWRTWIAAEHAAIQKQSEPPAAWPASAAQAKEERGYRFARERVDLKS
jgi:hypothetical protein